MKTAIIIPAFNEEDFIRECLESFVSQTRRPDKLLVVDDNSTDRTNEIIREFASRHHWIDWSFNQSTDNHQPGAKVVRAFLHGYELLRENYQLIGKFDADIVLPAHYLESVQKEFYENKNLGLCSGLLYIQEGDQWIYESIADRSHVRGPVKLYRRSCLEAMQGLREGLGWDTADAILARYYGFEVKTLEQIKVKHLRPTGKTYDQSASFKQGQAYYQLRYGFLLSLLSAVKMAMRKKSLKIIWNSLSGYLRARQQGLTPIVNKQEGLFIRKFRWKTIRQKLF